jgi:hypothetical protein
MLFSLLEMKAKGNARGGKEQCKESALSTFEKQHACLQGRAILGEHPARKEAERLPVGE